MAESAMALHCFVIDDDGTDRITELDSLNDLRRMELHVESIYYKGDYARVIQLTDSIRNNRKARNQIDSIAIAKLYYHRFESYYRLGQKQESIIAANNGLTICPDITETKNLKAILFYKRAYGENDLNFSLRSRQSMLRSVELLESHTAPNLDYLIGGYMFLSSQEAYHGNLKKAKRYLRLAERSYQRDKLAIDKAREGPNGENDRYEVMLPYRQVYLLYSLGETQKDSLAIEKELHKLIDLSEQKEFGLTYESIYVTQALNHAANWFVNKSETVQNPAKYEARALALINQAIELIETENFSGYVSSLNFLKARVLTNASNYLEASKLIDRLLNDLPEDSNKRPYFMAQKGVVEAIQHHKKAAIQQFKKTIELLHQGKDALNNDFSNYKPNTSFGAARLLVKIAQKLSNIFPDDQEVTSLADNYYTVALRQFQNSMLNTKFNPSYDRLLRDILGGLLRDGGRKYATSPLELSKLLETAEVIKNQLEWKRFNQSRLTNKLSDLDSIKARGLELRKQLVTVNELKDVGHQDSLQILLNQNEKAILKRYPNLALMDASGFELRELQEKLTQDSVVLKFMMLEEVLAVFVITKNSVSLELKSFNATLRNRLETFVNGLKNQNFQTVIAKELGDVFLTAAHGYRNVVINPDAALFKLPFETLMVNQQLALEAFNIRYTSNLGFIDPEIIKPKQTTNLAVYVPDYDNVFVATANRDQLGKLMGAQKEAYAISRFFTTSIYDKETLTKEVFFNTASKASLLHLAMHSQINNEKPELSKLLFSQNNSDHDNLYLEEIYGLDLKAELVVLSACNTGVGKENAGRSLESFQRAFTFAGVPAAVASLWEVPDLATQDIMIIFYDNLKQGQSKSLALKNAKNRFRNIHKGTKLEQPYYWAGFVLYGADDPVVAASSSYYWLIVAGALVIGFLIWRRGRHQKRV